MNRKTLLMNRLLTAVCICGLVPATAWLNTTNETSAS
jgi:hypothetical protein